MHLPRASERNLRNPSYMKQLGSTYKSNRKHLKSLNVWNDMHDLSVFGYWDQMSSSPVSSLCTNVISGGSYADSGARPSRREIPKSQDHFSACSSCWRNDGEELWQEPSVAARMPLMWLLQLAVGESSPMSSPCRARSQPQRHCSCLPAEERAM